VNIAPLRRRLAEDLIDPAETIANLLSKGICLPLKLASTACVDVNFLSIFLFKFMFKGGYCIHQREHFFLPLFFT
jgi:hypothetical protein